MISKGKAAMMRNPASKTGWPTPAARRLREPFRRRVRSRLTWECAHLPKQYAHPPRCAGATNRARCDPCGSRWSRGSAASGARSRTRWRREVPNEPPPTGEGRGHYRVRPHQPPDAPYEQLLLPPLGAATADRPEAPPTPAARRLRGRLTRSDSSHRRSHSLGSANG